MAYTVTASPIPEVVKDQLAADFERVLRVLNCRLTDEVHVEICRDPASHGWIVNLRTRVEHRGYV